MNTTNNRSRLLKNAGASLAFFTAIGIAPAQNVVAKSAGRTITLTPNPAMVTFVATKANTVEGAAKDAVLSAAKGQVISSVLRAVPIPIVGPLAGPLIGTVLNKM